MMVILQTPSKKFIFFFFLFLLEAEFVKSKSIGGKEVKVIESILFRSSDGEAFNGYLQTTDSRPLTVYCEATSVYSDIKYEIKILHQTVGAVLQIVGRSVTFTPPLDLVVQCRAKVAISSEDNYMDTLLIVKGQPPVRLTAGQQPNEGILQVFWNSTWSTVPQEGIASTPAILKQNGEVLCRMLGFSGFFKSKSSDILSLKENDFAKYPVKFECSGRENNIHNCVKRNLKSLNTTFQPARVTCQSSHMLAPNQNAVLVSEKKDIQVQLQASPFNRSIYVTENVTVKCVLEFQLPRFHVAQLFALKNDGSIDKLHSKITRSTISDRNVQIIIEYNFTASLENSNSTFVCRGMDNISQVYKDTSKRLIFKEGLTNFDVISDPQKCTYNFQCSLNENVSVERSWSIHFFNKSVESNVSQSSNLELSCSKLDPIEKICCAVNRKIYTATFSTDKCFDMFRHSSFKLNQKFTTLGFSGRYGILQQFKVPLSGCYEIVAKGASGGNYRNTRRGGLGAKVVGKFNLVLHDVYTVVVGQAGKNSDSNAGGGGGGASVVYKNSELLIIAGGGGGGSSRGDGKSGINNFQSGNCSSTKYFGGFGASWDSQNIASSNVSLSYANSQSNYWIGGSGSSTIVANDGGFGGGGAGIVYSSRRHRRSYGRGDRDGGGGGGGGFIGGEAILCYIGYYDSKFYSFSDGGSSHCGSSDSCDITEGGNQNIDGEVVFKYVSTLC